MAPRLSPLILPKVTAAVTAPFRFKDWPLNLGAAYSVTLRTWTWQYNPNLIGKDRLPPGEISTALPPQPQYPVSLRGFATNSQLPQPTPPPVVVYLPSRVVDFGMPAPAQKGIESTFQRSPALTAEPRAPIGEQSTNLPIIGPAQPLRSSSASYNLNLIGQDQLPVGERATDLPPRPYEYRTQIHSWIWSYNLNLIGKDNLPAGEISVDLTPRGSVYPVDVRTITESFNLNLIGQDQLPVGEISTALPSPADYPIALRSWIIAPVPPTVVVTLPIGQISTALPATIDFPVSLRSWLQSPAIQPTGNPFAQYDWPINYGPQQQVRSWTASYNLNLIGKDQLPVGAEVTVLTPKPYEYAVQLRGWTWSYNLNLIGKDQLPVGENVTDLAPRGYTYPLDIRTITESFNLNLIGQDKLPAGEVVTDLPPRAPQQPIPIFAASYNKNLIGQDQLPTGETVTDLPPRDYLRAIDLRTWIQNVNLALTTQAAVLPFNQYSWPLTPAAQQPTPILTASFNKNLIGKDRLPFRQQDWPNPTQPWRSPTLATWIDRAKAYLQLPFHQTDWPLPRPLTQPDRSFISVFPRTLIGRDRLPIRQQDWPLPRDGRQPYDHAAREFVSGLNLALKFPPTPITSIPRNQFDWPNPRGWTPGFEQRYTIAYQGNNLLPIWVSPIPPVPPPSPPEDRRIAHNPGNEWQLFDRIREPGPVGWR